jgi:hypothetical protein
MTKPWMIKAGQNKSDQGAFIHTRNAVTIAQDKDFMIVDSEEVEIRCAGNNRKRNATPITDVIIFDGHLLLVQQKFANSSLHQARV